jgi:hypothetical protein
VVAQFGANASEDHYLPAIIFHYIHKDRQGLYWLATGDGGLIRFSYDPDDPGSLSYKQYKKKDGLPSLELYAIPGRSKKGVFGLVRPNGLVQFNPETEEVLCTMKNRASRTMNSTGYPIISIPTDGYSLVD